MTVIRAAGAQIQGKRMRQEDAWHLDAFSETELFAIVADGLGGHPAGDTASREAVAEMTRAFLEARAAGADSPRDWLKDSVLGADRHLRVLAREAPELYGMATTLVSLYVRKQEFWAASVGDSYLLLRRGEQLIVLNELHAEGGGVTSCVGFNLTRVDLADRLLVEPGDRYVLASDGITTLDAEEIGALLGAAPDPDTAARALLAAVEDSAQPHQDNVTVIVIFADA
jgi:serine/threonine protein phosphatase PrpC